MARKNSESTSKGRRMGAVFGGLRQGSKQGLVAFGIVFAAIGGYVLLRGSFAAPPPAPTIYLTPSTKTLAVNTTFSVQVRENSGPAAVNAVEADFSYPANLLDFVSIDTTGTAFTTIAPSSGGAGQVKIAQGEIGSVSGDQLVATVTFKTKTTGGTAAMAFTSGTELVDANSNADILGSLSATGGASYLIDTVAPTVNITSPTNGASIAGGSTATIAATATDNDAVSSVDMYIDGTKVATLTGAPYTYSWNTAGVSLGNHTIQVKAADPSGNLGSSTLETVTVADQTPPTAAITSPANNALIKGVVTVSANAADNSGGSGVAKVELYVDGVLKTTDTTAPYSFSWDTSTATNAAHRLTVIAYDKASPANTVTSSAVNVTVDNSPPTTPVNFHMTGNTLTSITLGWSASTDNIGVSGYRITRNGATIATTSGSTLSYNDTGLTASTSYNYTIVALDALGNVSPAGTLTAATVTAKIGDLNGDNQVNITDLSIFLSNWNTSSATADLNHDGTVNIIDLSILLSNWGS
jgi:chitodextrinase